MMWNHFYDNLVFCWYKMSAVRAKEREMETICREREMTIGYHYVGGINDFIADY